jgi:predicted O-methyltransferase YrrM
MNAFKFDDNEAKFIAKEIILKRLNTSVKNANKIITYSISATNTLSDITSLEKKWSYTPKDNLHSYGRKVTDEKIGFWSVPSMSAKVLAYLVLYTGAKNILEIGTSVGYSTIHLATAVKQTRGKVNTIECLSEKIKIAKTNFKKANVNDKINLIAEEASQVLANWKGGVIDFVFLDADKENYRKYFDILLPMMSNGALIVADNINDYGHMMEDYLQKVSGTHLAKSRCDGRVKSTYVAQLDNGLMITKKL